MLLNELKPGLKYEVEECGHSPATKRFVMTVTIDGQPFEGSGASKKLAKQACARMALTALYNLSFTPGLISSEGQENDKNADEKDQLVPGNIFSQFRISSKVSKSALTWEIMRVLAIRVVHSKLSSKNDMKCIAHERDEKDFLA